MWKAICETVTNNYSGEFGRNISEKTSISGREEECDCLLLILDNKRRPSILSCPHINLTCVQNKNIFKLNDDDDDDDDDLAGCEDEKK